MRRILLLLALALGAAACLVPDVNLEGKACSAAHPCAEGYQCADGTCLLPEHVGATDGGSADGG